MRSILAIAVLLCITLIFIRCDDRNNEPTIEPDIQLKPLEITEGNTAEIILSLDRPSSKTILISWTTQGITATEDIDFEHVENRNTIISPGNTEIRLPVTIIDDEHLEFVEKFRIIILEAEHAEIWSTDTEITIIDDDVFMPEKKEDGYITPLQYRDMELVWHDEFEKLPIKEDYWNFDKPNGFPLNCGWGRDELGKYTGDTEHLTIEEGKLKITATLDQSTNIYRTSRINSNNKITIQYGRIDIRARIPQASGIATNFWMMGYDMDEVGWPVCGELDIMKNSKEISGKIQGGLVFDKDPAKDIRDYFTPDPNDLSDIFHIYTIVWEESRIRWFVDYIPFMAIDKKEFREFNIVEKPYFFTINLAVGGDFAGIPATDTGFPEILEIDYIRVYQRKKSETVNSN